MNDLTLDNLRRAVEEYEKCIPQRPTWEYQPKWTTWSGTLEMDTNTTVKPGTLMYQSGSP